MKTMPLSEVKTKLSELVDAVERRDEVVTITRNGKPVAIMVSKDEYEGWQETVEIMRDAKFMKEIRKGIQSLKRSKKRYTLDELFGDWTLGMPVRSLKVPAEVRTVIRQLHPELKRKFRAAIADILEDPTHGKALKEELEGYQSLQVGRSRIIYRVGRGTVEIVAIGPRQNVYEEAARRIHRDQEKPWVGLLGFGHTYLNQR
jgi:prevent-host-death family protein